MRIVQMAAIITLAGLAGGCTRPAVAPAPQSPVTVSAPVEQVWNAAVAALMDANLPIESMDKASGFIRTDELTGHAYTLVGGTRFMDLIDCGSEMGAPRFPVGTRVSYSVLLQSAGEAATTVIVRANALSDHVDMYGSQICVSKGTFEKAFAERIAARAAAGQ